MSSKIHGDIHIGPLIDRSEGALIALGFGIEMAESAEEG